MAHFHEVGRIAECVTLLTADELSQCCIQASSLHVIILHLSYIQLLANQGATLLSSQRSAAGPLFAVVLGAAALGASLVFSTAAFFILVPLALAALPLTFGLFAGAFVVKGLVLTLLNVVSTSSSVIGY